VTVPIAVNLRPVRLPLGAAGFARLSNVPRETLDRLMLYVDLLGRWNRRINLVGANTMGDVWRRHILDSTQLFKLLPRQTQILTDLGSGAGLPGLVLAAMGIPEVHLIESDLRKAAFLREAARVMGVTVTIHPGRIERVPAFAADAVVARACAPLDQLIELAEKFLSDRTLCLFPKGEAAATELAAARATWAMSAELVPSLSDPTGTIVRLSGLRRTAT
jgi:16S rRNA (guanine527-N7)-methyltransferase